MERPPRSLAGATLISWGRSALERRNELQVARRGFPALEAAHSCRRYSLEAQAQFTPARYKGRRASCPLPTGSQSSLSFRESRFELAGFLPLRPVRGRRLSLASHPLMTTVGTADPTREVRKSVGRSPTAFVQRLGKGLGQDSPAPICVYPTTGRSSCQRKYSPRLRQM